MYMYMYVYISLPPSSPHLGGCVSAAGERNSFPQGGGSVSFYEFDLHHLKVRVSNPLQMIAAIGIP